MSAALSVAERKGFSLALTRSYGRLPEAMLDGHIPTGVRLFAKHCLGKKQHCLLLKKA